LPFQAVIDILVKKIGKTEIHTGPNNSIYTVTDTVELLLEKAIRCASEVHKFVQNMQKVKMEGHANLPYEEKWIALDGTFERELHKICVIEEAKEKALNAKRNYPMTAPFGVPEAASKWPSFLTRFFS
jgi:hypothetical protein